MKRRQLIALVGSAVVTWTIAGHAQQKPPRLARIGFLGSALASGYAKEIEGFQLGLHDLGYVEGKNVATIATGIVASLAQPGGNITGQSFFAADLTAKWVELIKEMMPQLTRVALLENPEKRGEHRKCSHDQQIWSPSLDRACGACRTSVDVLPMC